METNITETLKVVTRKCKCCGKQLPIEEFMYPSGSLKRFYTSCSTCRANNSGASEKFKEFTSRELIEELRHRGYKGELTYIQKVVI